jgi:DNA polymerase I-like protein with 3'-5' exonuclease and polymerase domains
VFRARDGYVYVYIDMDAVELKGAAALAGASGYLELMESGAKDLHVYAMELIYGDSIYKMDGAPERGSKGKGREGSLFFNRRELTKTGVYLGLYWGEGPAFLRVLQQIERRNPETGALEFPYARFPVEQADLILQRWRAAAPEFETWWKKSLSKFRRDGYVEEPVSGLRRFLPDGEERSIIINHQVQGMCRAIFNNSIIRLTRGPVKFNLEERTGIVADTHDSIVVCCRWEDSQKVAADIEELMIQRYPQWPVTFTGSAKIRRNWQDPPCQKCRKPLKWVNEKYLHYCSTCKTWED